ncbi:MAG: Flp pilus assembly complex ATPase component TadA [Burkholderiaceae bacterium]|nr:Flp pilus assembly complex ATPase component TadA [Burkholderiaceae bacterium]
MSDLSLPPLTLVPLDEELHRAHPGAPSAAPGGSRAEPFAWPTPPLPAYPSPTCQIEPEPCVVESRSGSFISGLLTVFEPQEGVARVQVPGEKAAMPLRFAQIRRLTLQRPLRALLLQPEMAGSLDPAQAPLLTHHPVQPYEVTLVGGTVYQGRTVTHVENSIGLFLFEPKDEQGSVERHFIPRVAIERSQVGERLGDLLAEGDLERSRQIEQGVEAQRRLRAQKLGDILLARQVVTPEQLLVALDKQARMPLVRLGEALVALGFTDEDTLQRALHQQEVERAQPIGEVLVQRGLVSADEVRVALARKMGVPVVDVSTFAVDVEALRLVPGDLARRLGVLPLLRRGGRLVVAMADASRDDLLATLKDVAQCAVLPALAGAGDLPAAIERAYAALQPPAADPGPSSDMPAFPVLTAELIDVPRPRASAASRPGPAQPSGLAPFDATESRPGRGRASRMGDLAPAAPAAPALAAALAGARGAGGPGSVSGASGELRGRARLERADSPVVQAFVSLVSEALAKGASRIHLECLPGEDGLQVRLRRDGQLETLPALPAALRNTLIPRIKALAELDATETRRAQQGRLSFGRLAPAHKVDLHVATLPSSGGLEDLVIGLPSVLKPMKLDGLGLSGDDLGRWTAMLARSSGLILHVAPPRSGRTTTLHAALAHLNRPERRLWSIEERIELSQPGLRQMELRPGGGMDFAQGLQAVQQGDADVVMVADLRDPAAARAAVDAALSGRLVLGALPGRGAADGLMRLLDQGIDRWSLADALLGVHSQRLLRRLCSGCRMSRPAKDNEVQEWLDAYLHGSSGSAEDAEADREALLRSWIERFGREGKLRRYQSPGCERCGPGTPARQVAVHELLTVGREMRRLLRAGAPAWNLHRQAVRDGMKSLRQDGIEKMLAGKIGLEEMRQLAADL